MSILKKKQQPKPKEAAKKIAVATPEPQEAGFRDSLLPVAPPGAILYYLLEEKPKEFQDIPIEVEELQPMEGIQKFEYKTGWQKNEMVVERLAGSAPVVRSVGSAETQMFSFPGTCIVGITWDKMGRALAFMISGLANFLVEAKMTKDGGISEILRLEPAEIHPWRLI